MAVACDLKASIAQLAQLRGGHDVQRELGRWIPPVAHADPLGGNKHGGREAVSLKDGHRQREDAAIRIVEGDRDPSSPGATRLHDRVEGHNLSPAREKGHLCRKGLG